MSVAEHEHEPVRGLPGYLPEGETLIWRGEPDFRVMALRVFHLRSVALYIALLLCVHFGVQIAGSGDVAAVFKGGWWMIGLGVTGIGIVALLAWAYTRSTVYTITDKRVVLRLGVAIPMMVNLPLPIVGAADLRRYGDGSGDIFFTLAQKKKLSYTLLWPSIKPWQFKPVVPALRCLRDVDEAAAAVAMAVGEVAATDTSTETGHTRPDTEVRPVTTGEWVGAS